MMQSIFGGERKIDNIFLQSNSFKRLPVIKCQVSIKDFARQGTLVMISNMLKFASLQDF